MSSNIPALWVCVLVWSPSFGQPVAAQVPQIMTQVQQAGREFTIYANGIPPAPAPADMSFHLFSVGPFLKSGRNTIRFESVRRTLGMVSSGVVQENRPDDGLTDLARIGPLDDDEVGRTAHREVTVTVDMPRPYAASLAGGVDATPLQDSDEALGGAGVATHAGEPVRRDAPAQ